MKKTLWGLAILALLAVFCVPMLTQAEDPFTSRPHSWNAQQRVNKEVEFQNGSTLNMESGSATTFDAGSTFTINTDITKSGATETPSHDATAYLGGTTSIIAWTYQSASGVSPSLTTQPGNSGWFLTAANMLAYKTFRVDPTGASGASEYTHQCPVSVGGAAGATIYLPALASTMHDMVWTFINDFGTTPFVLYDPNTRIYGGSTAGTTESPYTTTNRAPEDRGDSVTIRAVYSPLGTSGWYVTNIWNYD